MIVNNDRQSQTVVIKQAYHFYQLHTENFMVTQCINNIQHFNNQLMHTTFVELLKFFKISKAAPTCFSLQGNHHQGATIST